MKFQFLSQVLLVLVAAEKQRRRRICIVSLSDSTEDALNRGDQQIELARLCGQVLAAC